LVLSAATDLSVSNSLIQMDRPERAAYDTAFTIGCLRGVIFLVAIALAAAPISKFYSDDRLFMVLLVLATTPLIQGLASPRMIEFQREMQFHQAFFIEASAKVLAVIAAVGSALLLKTYWAIVIGMVISPFVATILSYFLAPYRPKFGLKAWTRIFSFSGWITLANVINTLNFQADRFFIGGKLGPSLLGQYSVGSDLAALPTNAPLMPVMQSLYAAFTKLSGDLDRLRSAYMRSQCILLALALPISISVSVLADPIIKIALGSTWAPASMVVQILAPVFAFQMLTAPAQSVAMALGQTRGIYNRDVLGLAVRLPLIFGAVYLGGLEHVVWARVFSGLFIIFPNLWMMKRLIGASVIGQLAAPWRSYASALVLGVVLSYLTNYFQLKSNVNAGAIPTLVGIETIAVAAYVAVHFSLWALTKPDGSVEFLVIKSVRSILLAGRTRGVL
jgi:PST family polysaccharide transporter